MCLSSREARNGRGKKKVVHTSDYVCVQILLNDGLALDDAALGGRCGLLDVLLDVMHDVVVNGAVEDGLHLNHAVLADRLLHDWCTA
jgi:hypothetical protein